MPSPRSPLPGLISGGGLVLLAVLSLSACGTDAPHPATSAAPAGGTSGSQPPSALAFAQCMRSHGITNFPDPDSQGHLMLPPGIDPDSSQFQAAGQACQSLLPSAGPGQVTAPTNLAGLAKYAKCMQQHGVPMSAGGNGQISFGNGADPNSPQFQKATRACQKLVPAGLPGGAP